MLRLVVLLTLIPLESSLDEIGQLRVQRQYDQALSILEQVEREAPERFRSNHLLYLQAVVEKEAGLMGRATAHFEEMLRTDFPLPDALLLHLISSSEASPLPARRGYFEAFLTRFPSHPRWAAVAVAFAGALRESGQAEEAMAWYGQVVAARRGSGRHAQLNLAILQLQTTGPAEGEKRALALSALSSLIAENQADQVALQAAEELHRHEEIAGVPEQELQRRARVFLNHRQTRRARLYLGRLMSAFGSSVSRAEYEYLNARAASIDGDRKEAVKLYQATWTRFPQSSWGITSRYLAGNLLLGLGDYRAAADSFLTIVQNHPGSDYMERAAAGLIDAHLWLGERSKAEEILRALTRDDRGPRLTLNYYLARLQFEGRRYREAAESLGRISHLASEQLPPGVTREEVLFLRARSLEQTGSKQAALPVYQQAMLGSPNHFAHLSRKRLPEAAVGEALKSIPVLPTLPFGTDRLLAARSLRVSGAAGAEGPSAESIRVRELLFLRLFDEAYLELKRRESESLFESRADYLFQLAHFASRGGLYRESLDEAERLRDLLYGRTSPDLYPAELRALLYPLHYRRLIEQYAGRHGIDPFLVLALVRQESSFNTDAVSSASARGLMQLMPATARELAGRLKMAPPNATALHRPEVSIQLGSAYLKQMLNQFGGIEKALAAYNGGPGNVRRWERKLVSDDPLVFVANIGFRETKLYVLRVLGHYWTYQALYGEEKDRRAPLPPPR
jgi:soluble lytic murein transglycosylase-like protein/TolA-binding protein